MRADHGDLRLSLVVPMHGVERYLPDFLGSVSGQLRGAYTLEIVFVDDGSPDRSASLAADWLEQSPTVEGCVIRQQNCGVSAARNVGLSAATGDWVSFPDPDDVLDGRYLAEFADFLAAHGGEADAATAYIVHWDEARDRVRDIHPLRERFARGSRVVDLAYEPDVFLMNVATAFFPRERLEASGARFVPGLHASEDALFVADYFLSLGRSPRLGLVAQARYRYRKRLARTSAVDGYRERADSYLERFVDGYLPRLRTADGRGRVPRWLQHMLVYEYRWLYGAQGSEAGFARALSDGERAQVLSITQDCLRLVSIEAILAYAATELGAEVRALLLALKGALPDDDPPFRTRMRGMSSEYRWLKRSGAAAPVPQTSLSTSRRPDYFGQTAMTEWVAWLPHADAPKEARSVPPGRRLSSWGGRRRPRARVSWRLRELGRGARATWLSRVGVLRIVTAIGRPVWVIESPPASKALLPLAEAVRARGHRVIMVDASRVRGRAPRSRTHMSAMLRARVVVVAAERAELVAGSQPQGAPRKWVGVGLVGRTLERPETAGLEFAQLDLVIAADGALATAIEAADSGCGYVPDDIVVAQDPHQIAVMIERRLAAVRSGHRISHGGSHE